MTIINVEYTSSVWRNLVAASGVDTVKVYRIIHAEGGHWVSNGKIGFKDPRLATMFMLKWT